MIPLNILSLNAQGINNNLAYIKSISDTYDLICLQEHWLHGFEKGRIYDLLPGYTNHCICYDEERDVSLAKRPSSIGGLATLWKNSLSQYVGQPDPESSNRILITPMAIPGHPICIINCYLPSGNSKDALRNFQEDIDKIHCLLEKYEDFEILVIGDLNMDHYSRDSVKEKQVKDLIEQHQLRDMGKDTEEINTYDNPFLGHKSRLDHAFLKQKPTSATTWANVKLPHLEENNTNHLNTSYHHPISTLAKVKIKSKNNQRRITVPKPGIRFSRGKTDWQLYRESLHQELEILNPELLDTESSISAFQSILNTAMLSSTPHRTIRTAVNRNQRKSGLNWTPELEEAVKTSKLAHFRWKEAGRPREVDNQLYREKKTATKVVRKVQRRQNAEERTNLIEEINAAAENEPTLFHKLVKKKKEEARSTALLVDGNILTDEEKIRETWANYFEELSSPKNPEREVSRNTVDLVSQMDNREITVTTTLINNIIKDLRKKKAADIDGFYAEQLQMLTPEAIGKLAYIIGRIFQERRIPESLKRSYKLPIPKKGKDSRSCDNYRGITVNSILLKIVEEICLRVEIENVSSEKGNDLQFGFTSGRSPSMASLLITEAIAQAKEEKKPLYAASLDARKAFDVVDQNLLLSKLWDLNISGNTWQIINTSYTCPQEVVRWQGKDSRSYTVTQGVKQGGILSPSLYKIYIHDLLQTLQKTNMGTSTGIIYTGSPTCADDILLLSNTPAQLQGMLDIAYSYSKRHKYEIHPTKSVVTTLVYPKKLDVHPSMDWHLGGTSISREESFIHLGINWTSGSNNIDVEHLIKSARRTAYSMMRIGLHGVDGLGPRVSFKIVNLYILPKLLHGLDAIVLGKKDLEKLESFYRRTLRQLQGFPENSAKEVIYLLFGSATLEALYHIKVMTLFGMICRLPPMHQLHQLCRRQLALRDTHKNSWITLLTQIGEKYNIQLDKQILFPWPKNIWKKYIRQTIKETNIHELSCSAGNKSSLKWLVLEKMNTEVHPIWQTAPHSWKGNEAANVRARMLIGRYKTEKLLHKFKLKSSSICSLCKEGEEGTCHMITRCRATAHIREEPIKKITALFILEGKKEPQTKEEICMTLLNGGIYRRMDNTIVQLQENRATANRIANNMCHTIDTFRNSFNINKPNT